MPVILEASVNSAWSSRVILYLRMICGVMADMQQGLCASVCLSLIHSSQGLFMSE